MKPTEKSGFLEILEEVLPPEDAASYDLHGLWSALPDAERQLLDHPSAENFARYRELIKGIAAATLKKNTRVRTLTRRGRKGQDVQLQVVEVIDQRLQQMAIMMQSQRNSAFVMLKTFEEIRGLLLDVRE